MKDCPQGEDEEECQDFDCPGLYRCRDSQVCLYNQYLCDGIPQCPDRDDELLCNEQDEGLFCPDPCLCYGLAVYCNSQVYSYDVALLTDVRVGEDYKTNPNILTTNGFVANR